MFRLTKVVPFCSLPAGASQLYGVAFKLSLALLYTVLLASPSSSDLFTIQLHRTFPYTPYMVCTLSNQFNNLCLKLLSSQLCMVYTYSFFRIKSTILYCWKLCQEPQGSDNTYLDSSCTNLCRALSLSWVCFSILDCELPVLNILSHMGSVFYYRVGA